MTETPSLVQKSSDKFQIKNTETNEYLDIENAASANLLWRIDKIGEYFTRGYPLQWKKIKHSTYRFMFQESISGKYLKSDDNIPNPILAGMYYIRIHEIQMKPTLHILMLYRYGYFLENKIRLGMKFFIIHINKNQVGTFIGIHTKILSGR